MKCSYGKLLSGNNGHPIKNATGKDDGEHTFTYSSSKILSHPSIELAHEGLILIALLCGGDYDSVGLRDCGPSVAHALARCGFGDSLVQAARTLSRSKLENFLEKWREDIREELKSNARGFLSTKKIKLARSIDNNFPNIDVLMLYVKPVTSENTVLNTGDSGPAKCASFDYKWDKEPNLMKLADLCEQKFEWGYREMILKRFRSLIWGPTVLRILRRVVLGLEDKAPQTPSRKYKKSSPTRSPSKRMITKHFSSQVLSDDDDEGIDSEDDEQLIVGIRGKRVHASTDYVPEYRLEIMPAQFVRLTESGIRGQRQPPTKASDFRRVDESCDSDETEDDDRVECRQAHGKSKNSSSPKSTMRVWMPAGMISLVEPTMVRNYEEKVAKKDRDKEERGRRKAARICATDRSSGKKRGRQTPSRKPESQLHRPRSPSSPSKREAGSEEDGLSAEEDFSDVFGLLPGKGKSRSLSETKKPPNRLGTKGIPSVPEEDEDEKDEHLVKIFSKNLPQRSDPWQAFKSRKPSVNRTTLSKGLKVLERSHVPSTSVGRSVLDILDADNSAKAEKGRVFSRTTSAGAILSGNHQGVSGKSQSANPSTSRRSESVQALPTSFVRPFPMLSDLSDDDLEDFQLSQTKGETKKNLKIGSSQLRITKHESSSYQDLDSGRGEAGPTHNISPSRSQSPTVQDLKAKNKGSDSKDCSSSLQPLLTARLRREKTNRTKLCSVFEDESREYTEMKEHNTVTSSSVDILVVETDSRMLTERATLLTAGDPGTDTERTKETKENKLMTPNIIVLSDSSDSERENRPTPSGSVCPDPSQTRKNPYKVRGNLKTQFIDNPYPNMKRGTDLSQRHFKGTNMKASLAKPRTEINVNMDDIIDLT